MTYDATIRSGDTRNLVFTVTTGGEATDVSGASWTHGIAAYPGAGTVGADRSGTVPSGTEITVPLSSGDTAIAPGRYYHELEVTDALGNVSTYGGYILIEPASVD
ncbi:hypothetical protein [uncultured Pseudodesulfovibrio sp.]|uniref:hypothetical protein n=1 Tax=uncultured Pseudodesulfovibrio sp. TaxID=2035858 RepID=UPI0029C86853|nr:hypothetical protein [uncultured Pseudodesulfovibrio sp.]